MAPYYTRRLSAEATDHCTRTPGQQTEKPKLPEERNVPKRYIVDRPQRPLCTAVMRWRCQRSGIGRGTATLLGIRPLVLGPKSIQNFCAYRGLAEESVSGHAAVSHQHGRHTHKTSRRLTVIWRGVSDGKSMATSAMDSGSAISDAGVQLGEAPGEDEEEREKNVVEWRFSERFKGMEDLFLPRGRIVRGTLTSGDEVMRAFKSC